MFSFPKVTVTIIHAMNKNVVGIYFPVVSIWVPGSGEQYVQSVGLAASGLDFLSARALLHCDSKPLHNPLTKWPCWLTVRALTTCPLNVWKSDMHVHGMCKGLCDDSPMMRGTQDSGRVYSTKHYTWKYYIRSKLQNRTCILNKYGHGINENAQMQVGRHLLRS